MAWRHDRRRWFRYRRPRQPAKQHDRNRQRERDWQRKELFWPCPLTSHVHTTVGLATTGAWRLCRLESTDDTSRCHEHCPPDWRSSSRIIVIIIIGGHGGGTRCTIPATQVVEEYARYRLHALIRTQVFFLTARGCRDGARAVTGTRLAESRSSGWHRWCRSNRIRSVRSGSTTLLAHQPDDGSCAIDRGPTRTKERPLQQPNASQPDTAVATTAVGV